MPASSERRWLDRAWADIETFIDEYVDLADREKHLLNNRWLGEAKHYDKLWRRQRRSHRVVGVSVIVAGLTTSLLASLGAPRWTLAVAAFSVAAFTALEGFLRLGERWRHQRQTALLLKSEGLRFLEQRPPYDWGTHRETFSGFIDQLEQLNERLSEAYLALQNEKANDDAARPRGAPTGGTPPVTVPSSTTEGSSDRPPPSPGLGE